MKINNISNEVLNLDDGTYKGVISAVVAYEDNNKVLIKIKLDDSDTTLIKFYYTDELGSYPWNSLFKALDTDETNDLIDKAIEFDILNNTSVKTGTVFSNIKKVTLIGK